MSESPTASIRKKLKYNEACLITNRHNLRYLCNYTGTNGYLLLTSKGAFFFTDSRYATETKKILPHECKLICINKNFYTLFKRELQKRKINILNFEARDLRYSSFLDLKKNLKDIILKPSTDLVEELREMKNKQEISYLKKAQQIAEKVFSIIQKQLRTGISEKEIAWQIEKLAHEYGADGISFPPIVAFGSNSGTPHHEAGTRKLKKGDLIMIDMGLKFEGYCSDMTRILFTAPPTRQQEHIYSLVLKAQEQAINSLKAGITAKKVDSIARNIIKKAKYGDLFQHSLGHGVGLQIHEMPNLSPLSTQSIKANTVVTVEPGIYLPGKFGVRIEDMILVDNAGITNLTSISKDIKSCIIRLKK